MKMLPCASTVTALTTSKPLPPNANVVTAADAA
jgi:hypothetical protein